MNFISLFWKLNQGIDGHFESYSNKCSNSIHLEKGKWPRHGQIECFTRRKFNDREIKKNYFSTIDPVADHIKILRSYEIYSVNTVNTLTPRYHEHIKKFKNLVHLELCLLYITSIEINLFNCFQNLSYLKLECGLVQKFPEFLFKEMKNLKTLSLVLKAVASLNPNHLNGLENLQRIKLSAGNRKGYLEKMAVNDCFSSLAELKELELRKVILNQFSLSSLTKLDKLKLRSFRFKRPFSKRWNKFSQKFKNPQIFGH